MDLISHTKTIYFDQNVNRKGNVDWMFKYVTVIADCTRYPTSKAGMYILTLFCEPEM